MNYKCIIQIVLYIYNKCMFDIQVTFTNPTNSTKSFTDKQILIFVLPVSNKKYTSALKFSCSASLIYFL